jgi:hypothetical protein
VEAVFLGYDAECAFARLSLSRGANSDTKLCQVMSQMGVSRGEIVATQLVSCRHVVHALTRCPPSRVLLLLSLLRHLAQRPINAHAVLELVVSIGYGRGDS